MSKFPFIRHISDVLPYVEDDKAFKIIKKDTGHTFINYVHMGLDVFPPLPSDDDMILKSHDDYDAYCAGEDYYRAIVRRECRGIAFYEDGSVASRPFHKFFNVGERDETLAENLPFDQEHYIMDKMDGSMLRPLATGAGIRWGTKMGVTTTSMWAEEFLAGKANYQEFALDCIASGYTPIFEYVSKRNRIVVDYAEESVVLLAMRNNTTGVYVSYSDLEMRSIFYDIPLVKMYSSGTMHDVHEFLSDTRESNTLDEGVVVAWRDGMRVKIKTDEYSRLHSVKDRLSTEHKLIQEIVDDNIDDVMPILATEDRERLEQFIQDFWAEVDNFASRIDIDNTLARSTYETKKDFALSDYAQANPMMRSIIFALWDGKSKDAYEASLKTITSGLTTATKWEETKQRIGIEIDWTITEE